MFEDFDNSRRYKILVLRNSALSIPELSDLVKHLKNENVELRSRVDFLDKNIVKISQESADLITKLVYVEGHKDEFIGEILDQNPSSIAIVDKNYKYLFVNKKYNEWFNVGRKQLVGLHVTEIIGEQLFETKVKALIDAALTGEFIIEENKIKLSNGSQMFLRTTFAPKYDRSYKIEGVYVYNIDLTALKLNEVKLSQSQAAFRTMLDSSPVGLVIVDSEGQIINFSDSFCRMLGYQKTELVDHQLNEFLSCSSDDLIELGKTDNDTSQSTCSYNKKDGVICYCDLEVKQMSSGLYKDHLIIGVYDVTHSVKSQIELEQKNKELEQYIKSNSQLKQFTRTVSHDLKSPLRTISSFAALLKKKTEDRLEPKELEYLELIQASSKRLTGLITDLLDYSVSNTQSLSLSHFKPAEIINVVVSNLQFKIQETKAEINMHNLDQEIYADSKKVGQIFQNLISNALKFMPNDKRPIIDVIGSESSTHWIFSIVDNGIGIDNKYGLKIFDSFAKLHSPDEYEGSGLGLSICYSMVNKHNGEIWLTSKVGKGSNFYFSIDKRLE